MEESAKCDNMRIYPTRPNPPFPQSEILTRLFWPYQLNCTEKIIVLEWGDP